MTNSIHPSKGKVGVFKSCFLSNLFVFFNVLIWALLFDNNSLGQTPVTYTASGTWVCPAGITSITVECWGAGGGGGTRTSNGGGGGGGGGAYAKSTLTVIPGNQYEVIVGSGGTAGSPGGLSSFNGTSAQAAGGAGVADNTTTGAVGGDGGASYGDIKHNGGNGGNAGAGVSGNGGGGGGAAGRNGGGNNGGTSAGGTANGLYGGNGGGGATVSADGTVGVVYGGGGGGAKRTSATNRTGGTGANGLVLITINNNALWQNPIIGTNISSGAFQNAAIYNTGDIHADHITVSGIGRGSNDGALYPSNANDRYNASNWASINTVNPVRYYYFTLTPDVGYKISYSSFSFTAQRTTNGPHSITLRSSLDDFTNNIWQTFQNFPEGPSTVTIDLSAVAALQNVSSSGITFRLYGGDALTGDPDNPDPTSQFSINDFIFTGSVSPVSPTLWQNQILGTNINSNSTYSTGNLFADHITVSGISRSSGLTNANLDYRYNASGWTTSASINTNHYFEFSLSPTTGYVINLTDFHFTGQRNNANGPQNFSLRSSRDGYANDIGTIAGNSTLGEFSRTIDLTGAAYQNIFSGPIIFRLYGFSSAGSNGQFSINDFAFAGAVVPIQPALWKNQIIGTNPGTNNPYTVGDIHADHITVSGIGRSLSGQNASDRYNAGGGWNGGSPTSPSIPYFEFTLTPHAGYAINFTDFSFTGERNDNGPIGFVLRSSLDGYATNIGSIANETGTSEFVRTVDLTSAIFQNHPGPITFRLCGWGANNNGNSRFSINDFVFNGTVEELPALWLNEISGTGINPQTTSPYTTGDVVTDSNLDVSGITKGAGLTGFGTDNRYNAYHWNGGDIAGAVSNEDFYGFTLTPHTGYVLSLVAFVFTGQRDNTSNSPQNFALRSSADGYANDITTFTVTGTSPSKVYVNLSPGTTFQDIAQVTFRMYGWGGSTQTERRFSINDFVFYGTLREVPPAANISFFPTASCPRELTQVTIAGDNFYGVSAVRFNGVDAQYIVNSSSEIIATVPDGASTGAITVIAAGVPTESTNDFTVYEVTNDVSLLQDDFNDNNLSNWTITSGGWTESTSSPITGARSLLGSSTNGSERWIRAPFNGAPIDLEEGPMRWRFNVIASGGTNALNGAIYVWLASNAVNGDNDNAQGYALRFEGNNIVFGLKGATESSWTPLHSHNAGSGKTGVEINRAIGGVWTFLTDDNGDFDNLTSRYTSNPDVSIVSGSYFGAFLDNINGLSLKLDDLEIIHEGRCHIIYYSQDTGDFTDVLWSKEREGGAVVSVTGDKITSFVIQENHVVAISDGQIAKHLTNELGGTLEFTDNKQLTLYRDFINDGIIACGNGSIQFIGNVDQSFSSSIASTLNNVIINCNGTVSFPSNVVTSIRPGGIVSIPRGTFHTGDNLVLRSSLDGTASIGVIASGSLLTGQLTLQRFIPNMTAPPIGTTTGSWVAVGTPITGGTVQQWNETVITTGFIGSDFPPPAYSFNNIQWYNESAIGGINNGYTGVNGLGETLHANRGYFFYTYANLSSPQNLLRVKGNIQQGTFNDTLRYTNNNSPEADGWNLLVNRYPSEIDFKSIAEAGTGGIKTYHLFDAETNNYKAYHTDAIGTAPQFIASGQSYFVKASAENQYLQYRESFKSNTGTAFERDNLEASFASIRFYKAANSSDECVLNFNDQATGLFEYDYDAVKIPSQEPAAAECALVSADGKHLTIDSRPLGEENVIYIPLFVKMPNSGTYRLRIEQTNNLPFGSCMFVEDLLTGNTIPFEEGQELVITHTGNYTGNRFLIHASPSISTIETSLDCFGAQNGAVELIVPQGEWTISLADTLGNSFDPVEGTTIFENLAAGEYIASATNALSTCSVSNKTVTINEPAEMVLTLLSSSIDHCNASSDAYIEWKVTNATNYNYVVSNQSGENLDSGIGGSAAMLLGELSADVYTVSITNYCGTQSFETSLVDTNFVSTEILSENISITLPEGASQTISIEQSNQNATQFVWSLSNGYASDSETFNYDIMEPGDYVLTLMAHNYHCYSADSISIFVDRAVGIAEEMPQAPVSFLQTKESLEIYLNIASSDMTTLTVFDVSGRIVWNMTTSTWSGKNISIGTGSFASGVYVVKTVVGDKEVLNKKFINP